MPIGEALSAAGAIVDESKDEWNGNLEEGARS